ncbi:MAG: nitronate monooxygenase [Cytophagales bacterium]|nr:nitronate monooxygenase [Armatimonadota bacterium]
MHYARPCFLNSPRPITLCHGVTLHAPLVQADLGPCDGPGLAAEVSRAGALGSLTVHALDCGTLRRRLARIRKRTSRPVLAAFTAPYESDGILETAFEGGIRHIQVFWWNGPRLAPRIEALGGTVFWQVGTGDQIREALDTGAKVLVAPGRAAGGQVRTSLSLQEMIAMVREMAEPGVSLVAGGGLATRDDVAQVLEWGADAALLGTRFLLSHESLCPAQYKARLLRASERELVLDTRVIGDWPCAPRRRIMTASGEDVPYLYAGRGIGKIRTLRAAAEIVRAMTPGTRR